MSSKIEPKVGSIFAFISFKNILVKSTIISYNILERKSGKIC